MWDWLYKANIYSQTNYQANADYNILRFRVLNHDSFSIKKNISF